MKNRQLILYLILTCVVSNYSVLLTAQAEEKVESNQLDIGGKSAILIEQDTGTILYDQNPHEKLPPASMTKVMTLLLIMEALESGKIKLDEKVRVSENAASMGGSQIFLEPGEEMTVEDLIKGIAVASANDASVALAERISGSVDAFVKEMNEKVEELNLENTKFQNTTGLPAEDHYSSAYDMGRIAQELLKHKQITDYTSIYEDYLRKGTEDEFWLVNTNKLVRFYPGVDGLKTGYTSEAKYCLAATAEIDDMRVIAVVLGFDTSKSRNQAVSKLLDYAYSQFQTTKLSDAGEKFAEITTLKGNRKKTDIISSQAVTVIHAKGLELNELQTEYQLNDDFILPITKGEPVGVLTVRNEAEIVAQVPLTVKETIEEASVFTLFRRSLQELTNFE